MANLILNNESLYVEPGYVEEGYVAPESIYGKNVLLAISRLTGQFDNSPLLQGLTAAMVSPIDVSESVANQIKTQRWIETAVGAQLDGCGYIVGESRKGRSDNAYREAIRYRVFVNISQGTPSTLIKGLGYLTHFDDAQYIEQYPATAMLFTDGATIPTDIHDQIQDLSPAAISDVPVMVSFAHAPPFRFSKSPDNRLLNTGAGTRLTANGNRISISPSETDDEGSRLGGIAPAFMTANGFKLSVGPGRLRINSHNHQTIIESGYHLTGCYQ